MENFVLVRPEHLNHYGYLFGGMMLKWVDEFAWIAATRKYINCKFVTVAMDKIIFKERVSNGSILRFFTKLIEEGKTSAVFSVEVFAAQEKNKEEKKVFSTTITFVNIDESGKKSPISLK